MSLALEAVECCKALGVLAQLEAAGTLPGSRSPISRNSQARADNSPGLAQLHFLGFRGLLRIVGLRSVHFRGAMQGWGRQQGEAISTNTEKPHPPVLLPPMVLTGPGRIINTGKSPMDRGTELSLVWDA